jgi:HK97 family phage prohead protease
MQNAQINYAQNQKAFFNYDFIERGVIEGYAIVFNNIDAEGHVIKDTAGPPILEKFKILQTIPVLFEHNKATDPRQQGAIGSVTELSVDSYGVKVKIVLNLALNQDGPEIADKVYKDLKENPNYFALSAGFIVIDTYFDKYLYIAALDLLEISITKMPVNPQAKIISVKSAGSIGSVEYKPYIKKPEDFTYYKGAKNYIVANRKSMSRIEINRFIEKAKELSIKEYLDNLQTKLHTNADISSSNSNILAGEGNPPLLSNDFSESDIDKIVQQIVNKIK